MINAYCDGGGNNKTKKDFYGSFVVDGYEIVRHYYDLSDLYEIKVRTTNEAEYQTLIQLLQWMLVNKLDDIVIHSDSMLVVNQVNGNWRVNTPSLTNYWLLAVTLLSRFKNVKLEWVSRNVIVKVLGH